MRRECLVTGVWGSVQDLCTEKKCPQEGEWPATGFGQTAVITCPAGYSGTYSRHCSSEAVWEDPDMATCTRLHCAADGIWPTTNTLTTATVPCGGDMLGDITRYCREDQTWEEPDSSGCSRGGREE